MQISDEIREHVLQSRSLAIWPLDENPLSESYRTAHYFQDQDWRLYPIHDHLDRLLEENCYRDIRLIPDDYDILLLFVDVDRLPEVVNAIFDADYIPPLIWAHTGIIDLAQLDRLTEAGVKVIMDRDLMDTHRAWID